MNIVAIAGKKYSGKSTVWSALKHRSKRLPLAGPLKEMVLQLPGVQERHVYGDLKEAFLPMYGCSARQLMQSVGQSVKEPGGDGFWLKVWEIMYHKELGQRNREIDTIVVDDVRFPYEYEYFRRSGALMLLCTGKESSGDTHASEATKWREEDFDHVFPHLDGVTHEAKASIVGYRLADEGFGPSLEQFAYMQDFIGEAGPEWRKKAFVAYPELETVFRVGQEAFDAGR